MLGRQPDLGRQIFPLVKLWTDRLELTIVTRQQADKFAAWLAISDFGLSLVKCVGLSARFSSGVNNQSPGIKFPQN